MATELKARKFPCESCGARLSSFSLSPGDALTCPECGQAIMVPDTAESVLERVDVTPGPRKKRQQQPRPEDDGVDWEALATGHSQIAANIFLVMAGATAFGGFLLTGQFARGGESGIVLGLMGIALGIFGVVAFLQTMAQSAAHRRLQSEEKPRRRR